jgi:hypothetical protein
MAAVDVSNKQQVAGIKYTYRTDDSSDWSLVPNRNYFFDLNTQKVFWKDSRGQIWDIYVNQKQYINYFELNGSVTTIKTADTWVKLNTVATTSLFSAGGELVHTNNRITYTGAIPRVFQIEGIMTVESGNNNEIHSAFFRNDTLYPCSEQTVTMSGSGKGAAVPFHCVIELQQNDYIEVWTKNFGATTDITLSNLNVITKEL